MRAVRAAYEKTSAAKAAKVHMTMSVPKSVDPKDGGDTTGDGIMTWDGSSSSMDVTMRVPERRRMIVIGTAFYGEMRPDEMTDAPPEMRGRKWMKLDLGGLASELGKERGPEVRKQMAAGLDDWNQSPDQQMALLLSSSDLQHVGEEKVNGVRTQHYRGTLTPKQMLESRKAVRLLDQKDREKAYKKMKQQGLEGCGTDVWVGDGDLPVRMKVEMKTPKGTVTTSSDFTDYSTRHRVTAPPAKETVDFARMLKDAMEKARRG